MNWFWIIEWLAGITECLIGFLFAGQILETKVKRYKGILVLSCISTFGLMLINYFSLFSLAATIYGVAAMSICVYILYKENPMDIIAAVGSYFLLLHLLDFFLIVLIELFTGTNAFGSRIITQLSLSRTAFILISKAVLVLCYIHLSKVFGKISVFSRKLLIGIVTAMALIYSLEKKIYCEMRTELAGIGILSLLVLIMGIYLMIKYTEVMETKIQAELLNERNNVITREYKDMLENYKNSSVYFHDLKHHMMRIEAYLVNHKGEEALIYIKRLDSDYQKIHDKTWTGTAIIDYILNYKKASAEKQEIKFEVDADLIQIKNISETDLCALLGNVIDNAIEHCEKVERTLGVWISIRKIQKMLVLKVANTCNNPPQRGKEHFTSKSEKKIHGWGMKSIEMIVEKYGGALLCEYENGRYSVTLTFFN